MIPKKSGSLEAHFKELQTLSNISKEQIESRLQDKNFMLALLVEKRLLDKLMVEKSTDNVKLRDKITSHFNQHFNKTADIHDLIIQSKSSTVIAKFIKNIIDFEGNDYLNSMSLDNFILLLNIAKENHDLAEAIFYSKENFSLADYILSHHIEVNPSQLSQDKKTKIINNIRSELMDICLLHKDLTHQLLDLLNYDYDKDTMGPFEKRTIDEHIANIEKINDGDSLMAMAHYYRRIYKSLINKMYYSDEMKNELKIEIEKSCITAIQNYLDCLLQADLKGNKLAKKEFNSNADLLRALGDTYLAQDKLTFDEFKSAFDILMRIKEGIESNSFLKPLFVNKDNIDYISGLKLLATLMLDKLNKLPGGETLTRAAILRAVLPFYEELKKLGDEEGIHMFNQLIAQLYAFEHQGKKLSAKTDFSAENLKKYEKNYLNGTTSKYYGMTLALDLEQKFMLSTSKS